MSAETGVIGRSRGARRHLSSLGAVLGHLGLALLGGCEPADLTVDGHDFHLSSAYVAQRLGTSEGDETYYIWIANVAEPCLFVSDPASLRPLDERWLQIYGMSRLDGLPSGYPSMGMCISEDVPCPRYDGDRVFESAGDEVIVADGERLSLSLTFLDVLGEAIPVELELPYTTCE